MADTTTPVTPPANDLQINLEEAPKVEEIQQPELKIQNSELNLDLDLNLPEAPKNDDRLKEEDQKNQQAETPTEIPVADIPTTETLQETPEAKITEETETKATMQEPEAQPAPEIEILHTEGQQFTEIHKEDIQPSSTIEEISAEQKENLPEGSNLQKDAAIINELEGHPVGGGLSSEAVIPTTPTPAAEPPKTFDLDAMLGAPPPLAPIPTSPQTVPLTEIPAAPTPIQQQNTETPTHNMPMEQSGAGNVQSAPTMIPPAFTIPTTTTTQVPVSAMTQATIPQKKAAGIKALLFVMLFAALGFTTFFILKTMYPVEFDQILGGNKTEQMHASEAVIEEMTGETMTGEYTEEETTGATEGMDNFGELNELGTASQKTEEQQPESSGQTDVSRLADYVNKGNELRETGKNINNNTIIKYGLYISKKATDLLEKIAKGEEIDNLSGYFAQFDQYIAQLEALLRTSTTPRTAEAVNDEGSSSPSSTTNDLSGMTETPEPTPTTNPLITE